MHVAVILIIILLLFVLLEYNSLVTKKRNVDRAKSGIDIYLTQRFNLIPNLVECVKAYSKHEEIIFEKISQMRINYMNTKDLKEGAKLNSECNHIMLMAEEYPELKANEHFLNLQKNLTKIESQLQAARRIYNSEVTAYNTKVSVVPSNIVASMFDFKELELFELETLEARQNIDVRIDK